MFYAYYLQFSGPVQDEPIVFTEPVIGEDEEGNPVVIDPGYTEDGAYLYGIPTIPHRVPGFGAIKHYLLITDEEWDSSELEAAGANIYETVELRRQEDNVVRAVWNQKPSASGPELMDLVRQMSPIPIGSGTFEEDVTRPATPADFWNKMKAWNVEHVNG
jgi:hypothetical protein